mmetsp:Transcript_26684/g.57212  ORF Transcript_26684/g.57212 Transcript_26684/m.57212 type:complete len:573 (+) Transcript_26684:333-2051(+)
MATETEQQFQEEEQFCSCCCRSDGRNETGGDNDGASPPPHHRLGSFIGGENIAGVSLTSLMTTGSTTNDQELLSRMIKSASSRLRRENVDGRFMATNEENGSVCRLRHSQIELGEEVGSGTFSSVFEIKSVQSNDDDKDHGGWAPSSRCTCLENESSSNAGNTVIGYNGDNNASSSPISSQLVLKMLKPDLARKPSVLSSCTADLMKEAAILASLKSHPHVVSIVGWTPTGIHGLRDNNGGCGMRHDAFFLVLGRLEHSLEDQLEEWRSIDGSPVPDRQVDPGRAAGASPGPASGQQPGDTVEFLQRRFRILTDLADGIRHVHSRGIIHRDLKPANIGFDRRGTLKLFDFDVARILPDKSRSKRYRNTSSSSNNSESHDDENATFRLTQHVGSQRYMSPECARGERYNAKTDVYAFGLICHEVLSLKRPYAEMVQPEKHFRLVFLKHERPSLPKRWPKALRGFVKDCWSDAISSRPTMADAFVFLSEEGHGIVAAGGKNAEKNGSGGGEGEAAKKNIVTRTRKFLRRTFSSSVRDGAGGVWPTSAEQRAALADATSKIDVSYSVTNNGLVGA